MLTETVTWDYGAYHPSWAGAPTLVLTEAGRALGRRSPEETKLPFRKLAFASAVPVDAPPLPSTSYFTNSHVYK